MLFTQPVEQREDLAHIVGVCPHCAVFVGRLLEGARHVASLVLPYLPREEVGTDGKLHGIIAIVYNADDVPLWLGLYQHLPPAAMAADEVLGAGGRIELHEVAYPPVRIDFSWSVPRDAALELGDAVRVILDSDPSPAVRTQAETILRASEHLREQVPALRDGDFFEQQRVEHEEALASGVFIGLVEVAVQYVQRLQVADPDSTLDSDVESMLVGLRENVADRFGI
jgi:hypothetical protein